MPVVSLQQVNVRFGKGARVLHALRDITLKIAPGERVALIGANGCGKSTLLRVLHGLIAPSTGQFARNESLRHAMVFQRPYLMRMSAQSNVALGLWLRGQNWAQARHSAVSALQQVGMAEHALRAAHRLSGGQQQRVALARAWAMQPQVLILDEPTSSLDPHAKREVEALIQQFSVADPAMTLAFASHNLGQVKRLATRVLYLEQGRLVADLPVHEFFDSGALQQQFPHAHAFVKGELV
ncbi:phosphate ABC transporter ATP-binding protein [Rhodoferax sp. GW822-FHT02A01]|uniref:ABC transporter ATP-binding protein n=1 Tax=Rhodoferax sp. GW822-FHT02A01 TaxID=3141537 RepID=UPI00315D8926